MSQDELDKLSEADEELLRSFLEACGMEHLHRKFIRNDVTNLDLLGQLATSDFDNFKISVTTARTCSLNPSPRAAPCLCRPALACAHDQALLTMVFAAFRAGRRSLETSRSAGGVRKGDTGQIST